MKHSFAARKLKRNAWKIIERLVDNPFYFGQWQGIYKVPSAFSITIRAVKNTLISKFEMHRSQSKTVITVGKVVRTDSTS